MVPPSLLTRRLAGEVWRRWDVVKEWGRAGTDEREGSRSAPGEGPLTLH